MDNDIIIFDKDYILPIFCNQNGGVLRVSNALVKDLERVTGKVTSISNPGNNISERGIYIGTVGESVLIDEFILNGEIESSNLNGKWDAFIIKATNNKIIIAGSNKRGTIYGIYDLCKTIGVSPLHWLADVPVVKKETLGIKSGTYYSGEPKVKYRGFFINDEYPCLGEFAKEKFGGFNSHFYEHVFDLLLRLKGNYLWPAMWDDCFFDDDPQNHILANELGIVMGTSHHEPMMRSWKEWVRYGSGDWNIETNGETVSRFWCDGIKRMDSLESMVTVGMRGDGDEPLTEEDQVEILGKILKIQREIIEKESGKPIESIPQLWAVYKEVQDAYEKGLKVPDDVLILLCDDNWGNLRKLPNPQELNRDGGFGLYYHFDYVGGPRNYKWINTNPLPRVWEQLDLAYSNGIDRLWVVNVGDIKPLEFPLSFFMDLAWDPTQFNENKIVPWAMVWAEQQFGVEFGREIGEIISLYGKYNGRIKPELLDDTTFSLINYKEWDSVVFEYNILVERVNIVKEKLESQFLDSFYQLVEYPVKACANLYQLYRALGLNKLYYKEERSSTNSMAELVLSCFEKDKEFTSIYNSIGGGRWNHIPNQTHIGYTYWQQPEDNILPVTKRVIPNQDALMGVSMLWEGDGPIKFYRYGIGSHFIELYNKGLGNVEFTINTSSEWITLSHKSGSFTSQIEIEISILWEKTELEIEEGFIEIVDKNGIISKIYIIAYPQNDIVASRGTYIEADGFISIDACNFLETTNSNNYKWSKIPDLGRTSSSMTILPHTNGAVGSLNPGPKLFYSAYFTSAGSYTLELYISPINSIKVDSGIQIEVGVNNSLSLIDVMSGYNWDKAVSESIWKLKTVVNISTAGEHQISVESKGVGIVLQKIVLYKDSLPYSYLGPRESLRFSKPE